MAQPCLALSAVPQPALGPQPFQLCLCFPSSLWVSAAPRLCPLPSTSSRSLPRLTETPIPSLNLNLGHPRWISRLDCLLNAAPFCLAGMGFSLLGRVVLSGWSSWVVLSGDGLRGDYSSLVSLWCCSHHCSK